MGTRSPVLGSTQGLNPGMYRPTVSTRRSLPCSTSCIMERVVPTHLDTEARSNMVSTVIGSSSGYTDLRPYAFSNTSVPLRTTPTTAPGMSPSWMEAFTVLSMSDRYLPFIPWRSGLLLRISFLLCGIATKAAVSSTTAATKGSVLKDISGSHSNKQVTQLRVKALADIQ